LAFSLIATTATIANSEVRRFAKAKLDGKPLEDDPLYDTIVFLFGYAANLIQLMFASLSGRYVVSLFQSDRHNTGYILFMVVAAVVLIRRASRAIQLPAAGGSSSAVRPAE
jgi:hypothetical protein